MFLLKKYGVALAILLIVIGLVMWAVVGQLSKPTHEPAKIDPKPAEIVEKAFTVEPKPEVTVEMNVPKDKNPEVEEPKKEEKVEDKKAK